MSKDITADDVTPVEELTGDIVVETDENGELTEEQLLAVDNLEKMFNLKVKAALAAILDGVSLKFNRKQSKIKKRKDGKPTRYEQGWLDANEELFNSIYDFLYALENADVARASNEVPVTNDDFDLFEAMADTKTEEVK